jgi:hypothetical protein
MWRCGVRTVETTHDRKLPHSNARERPGYAAQPLDARRACLAATGSPQNEEESAA